MGRKVAVRAGQRIAAVRSKVAVNDDVSHAVAVREALPRLYRCIDLECGSGQQWQMI